MLKIIYVIILFKSEIKFRLKIIFIVPLKNKIWI